MPPKLVGHPRNFAPPPPILPPVIFLDVDGVLHPTRGEFFFEPRCMLAPRSFSRHAWDLVMALPLLNTLVATPVSLGFELMLPPPLEAGAASPHDLHDLP